MSDNTTTEKQELLEVNKIQMSFFPFICATKK